MQASVDHSLPLDKIVNARDLGWYVTEEDRRIKKGLLIRCAHLAHASQTDLDFLAGLPVTRVVDFRLDFEKKGKEDRIVPGATYQSIPVDASGPIAAQATEEERKKFTGRKTFDVKKVIVMAAFNDKAKKMVELMYPTLVNDPDCQRQYATFLRLLVDNETGAVLFHCTQGKDRAGMAAAFVLAALGVGRDTIVADFDETNRHYAKDLKKYSRRVRFWGGKEQELAVVKAFIGANTENFIQTLDLIYATYGSMKSYLNGPLKLSDTDIQTLRERFLEA